MLARAGKTWKTEPCFGDLRRVGGRGGVGRRLHDVAVPGDGMHEGDRIAIEQPRQLALEWPEAAGVDLDDAAARDHVGDEAADGLLGRAPAPA